MHEEIFRNLPGNPNWHGSFYEKLTEYCLWDAAEFWKLHYDLTLAASETAGAKTINRDLALGVVTLKSKVSNLIAAHYDPNDTFKIVNLAPDELRDFTERFNLAILAVFSGEVIPESSFGLVNPLINSA